ncbi:MAG: hypothetical protein ABIC95_01400 [archaeon]
MRLSTASFISYCLVSGLFIVILPFILLRRIGPLAVIDQIPAVIFIFSVLLLAAGIILLFRMPWGWVLGSVIFLWQIIRGVEGLAYSISSADTISLVVRSTAMLFYLFFLAFAIANLVFDLKKKGKKRTWVWLDPVGAIVFMIVAFFDVSAIHTAIMLGLLSRTDALLGVAAGATFITVALALHFSTRAEA